MSDKSNINSPSIIEIKNLYVSYGRKQVLANINLKINKGDYVGLIGGNGAGKSTLLKSIIGLIKPTSGSVKILGKTLNLQVLDKIGYTPQMHSINHEFPATVGDIVEMGLYRKNGLFKRLNKNSKEKVMLALHKVKMESFIDRPIGHLSGGEQQKILVAQALVKEPEILFLDEPTSALDFVRVKEVLLLLDEMNKKYGITIIAIHHNLDLIKPFCNRLVVLKGIIRYDGDPHTKEADNIIAEVF